MAFHSPRDPGFWDLEPEFLKPVQAATRAHDMDIVHFVMGDPASPATPVAAMLRLPPHGVLARHAHTVERFEVIVQGALDVGERVLTVGDVMVSPAGEFYGPHTAGPDGCTTVEVFSSITGVGNVLYEEADGSLRAERYRPET
jgi:hypothetical protein